MTVRMILDSGAFSVWSQGSTVDLHAYLEFCHKHPDTTYFVSLDVIPGRPNNKASLTKDAIEEACRQGWRNYKSMIAELPKEKVIPVFHQNDDFKWLDKYLNFGAPYIGISPANDSRTNSIQIKRRGLIQQPQNTKTEWMERVRPFIFDKAGRPIVKTHGFAVTSYPLMKYWEWYSVDSASWKLVGAWGGIYYPKLKDGHWDFGQVPWQCSVSPMAPHQNNGKRDHNYFNLSRSIKSQIDTFVSSTGVPIGRFRLREVSEGYKLNRERDEIWFSKATHVVLRPIEKGISTHVEERLRVNAEFIRRAAIALKDHVKHIYMAGAVMPYPLEFQMENRLLSFEHLKGKSARRVYRKHLRLIMKGQRCTSSDPHSLLRLNKSKRA